MQFQIFKTQEVELSTQELPDEDFKAYKPDANKITSSWSYCSFKDLSLFKLRSMTGEIFKPVNACFTEVKSPRFNKRIYDRYDLFEKCGVSCVDKFDYLSTW